MKKSMVVLGLGSPLMADEGIGVCLIKRLAEFAGEHPDADFIDAGTGGLSVLHHIEGRRKAIFIDCADMGEEPGAIRRFTPEEVRSTKVLVHQSLHEGDLLHIITMARRLGEAPDQVVIFGIQPQRIELDQVLSPVLANRIDQYVSAILEELKA